VLGVDVAQFSSLRCGPAGNRSYPATLVARAQPTAAVTLPHIIFAVFVYITNIGDSQARNQEGTTGQFPPFRNFQKHI